MGRGLYESFPVFAAVFDEVCGQWAEPLRQAVRQVVFGPLVEVVDTAVVQPALFAVQVALFRLLESWGVTPDSVAGHSVGEIAAACVAGVFSVSDAARLVCARAALMAGLPVAGVMVAVAAAETDVTPLLTGGVAVAAVNGPRQVVVSGEPRAVQAVTDACAANGWKTRRLRVSHGFHSPVMDPILDDFTTVARTLTYHEPGIRMVSTVTGQPVEPGLLTDPAYWVRHVRDTVRYHDALTALAEREVETVLEIGPDGTLSSLDTDSGLTFVPALRGERDEAATLTTAMAQLVARGVRVDWEAIFAGTGARRVELPTYAFRHQHYWHTPARQSETDTDFWEVVDSGDVDSLTQTLGLSGDQPLSVVLPALSRWRRERHDDSVVDGWRYRVSWSLLPGVGGVLSGVWLLLDPDPGLV
ncbi:acyltransferase domain-containing protein, partial [Polymorphospora rubra]|uniref:acyltransferase domain-containing protein n=1 Tax=Polymorphospora rubra TaxID=338584 RepID=UPI0033C69FE4